MKTTVASIAAGRLLEVVSLTRHSHTQTQTHTHILFLLFIQAMTLAHHESSTPTRDSKTQNKHNVISGFTHDI